MKKILILGGGFGGVEFYKTLHKKMHGSPEALFQLVSRWNYFLFYPMLHEVATGSIERGNVTQPLREIAHCCVEQFVQAEVEWIDVAARQVHTSAGQMPYDYLVVALGVESDLSRSKGAAKFAVTMKSIADAVAVRNRVIHNFELAAREHDPARRRALLSFTIIGGGSVGVELAGQLVDLMRNELRTLYSEVDPAEIKITLIEGSDRILRVFAPEISLLAHQRLVKLGVNVLTNTRVNECLADRLILDNGEEIFTGLAVMSGGNKSLMTDKIAPEFLTARGGIKINQNLQLVGHPEIFVVGDGAEIVEPQPVFVPQNAQAATAEARMAAENLWRIMRHKSLLSFDYKSRGDIIPIGDWYAVAQIGSWVFSGRLAWWLRRTVFLQRIWSTMNRIRICLDWTLHTFLPRDTSEL